MREKWGCLEINWNTGILEQLEHWNNWNALLFSEASQVLWCLFFPRPFPSKDVLLSEALPVMDLPLAGPSHLLEASTAGYFRLLASPCISLRLIPLSSPVISRYHPLSHVISPNRIQSHRIALLGWQKDLTLQHEHDSWVAPPPDWPWQTPASPTESMSPRSLTYWHTKGGPNLWQARRHPPQPQREKRNPLRLLAQEVERLASLLVADGLLHFSVIGRREICILAW